MHGASPRLGPASGPSSGHPLLDKLVPAAGAGHPLLEAAMAKGGGGGARAGDTGRMPDL